MNVGDEILLLSEKILDYRQFDQEIKFGSWKNSAVRKWLNEEFIENAFSDSERSLIQLEVLVDDSIMGNLVHEDRARLIDASEAFLFFADAKDKFASDSDYSLVDIDGDMRAYWTRTMGDPVLASFMPYQEPKTRVSIEETVIFKKPVVGA